MVKVWDAARGVLLSTFAAREPAWRQARIVSLAFNPDGRTLASGSYEGITRLWDVPAPRKGGR
jgi:WD40 repeat protein